MFLTPTIRENLSQGGSIQFAALVIAVWCYYSDKQTDRNGNPLEITDELKDVLRGAATATSDNPLSFLKVKPVFGDLANDERFTKAYAELVERVYQKPDVAVHMRDVMHATDAS